MKRPMYVVWNSNHLIQVPIIDEQHHGVATAINSLYFFINQDWGLNSLLPTLKIVKAIVAFHMKTEEELLAKLGASYDVISLHRALHQQFIKESTEAYQAARFEKEPMLLLQYLRAWLINHADVEHEAYEPCFKKIVVEAEEY